MSEYKYKVSVIIPVYNCEKHIRKCVESLREQTMPYEDFQIVFINDGSPDNSGEICRNYAEADNTIVYFEKENGGVSSARNKGIDLAEGKYLMFLDADDTLSKKSLQAVYNFFENHYDETDLVTYSIDYLSENGKVTTHKRFDIMTCSGIYDVMANPNILQTTMNICVKNVSADERIYFDESLSLGEDQWFIFSWLKKKGKLGFCRNALYTYYRHGESASQSFNSPYYCFDQYMSFLNKLIDSSRDENGKPHPVAQALVVYNLSWRITSDMLVCDIDDETREKQLACIQKVLSEVDNSIIADSIYIDPYHVDAFMKLKGQNYTVRSNSLSQTAYVDDCLLFSQPHIITFNTFRIIDGKLHTSGYFKNGVGSRDDVHLYCALSNGNIIDLPVQKNAYSYYKGKSLTNDFAGFDTVIDLPDEIGLVFHAVVDGHDCVPNVFFGFKTVVNKAKFYVKNGNYTVLFDQKSQGFLIRKPSESTLAAAKAAADDAVKSENKAAYIYRKIAEKTATDKRIWLYIDREGIFDNAYYQFIHDFPIKDGIERYYIADNLKADDKHFTSAQKKRVVKFKSFKHKMLFFNCEKVLTSFNSLSIMSPFDGLPLRWYSDIIKCEFVYLQHGILHARLPMLYTKEKANVDKVVISSEFERENFKQIYNFKDSDLLASGMPRFDSMETDSKAGRKLLFSPSWRKNLIGNYENNTRQLFVDKFLNSSFYRETNAFLNSKELADLLEKYDYTLDFKNHPIFRDYDKYFKVDNPRIRVTQEIDEMQNYALMITDYSSIVFDFVYLGRPIMYFVPDYDLFRAGVTHDYKALDLPLEEAFGALSVNAQELLSHLEKLIANDMKPDEVFAKRCRDFFITKENHCDKLYELLMK